MNKVVIILVAILIVGGVIGGSIVGGEKLQRRKDATLLSTLTKELQAKQKAATPAPTTLKTVTGKVVSKGTNQFTIQDSAGKTQIVQLGSSTSIVQLTSKTVDDLSLNQQITVAGQLVAPATISASVVRL